jgi:hypothetical protein
MSNNADLNLNRIAVVSHNYNMLNIWTPGFARALLTCIAMLRDVTQYYMPFTG